MSTDVAENQSRQNLIKKEGDLTETQQKVLKALELQTGNVSAACKAVNVGRSTFYAMLKKNPLFAAAVLDIREGIIDWAESKLYQAIDEGNITALIFFLKCHGKERGWIEKPDRIKPQNDPPFQLSQEVKARIREERDRMFEDGTYDEVCEIRRKELEKKYPSILGRSKD